MVANRIVPAQWEADDADNSEREKRGELAGAGSSPAWTATISKRPPAPTTSNNRCTVGVVPTSRTLPFRRWARLRTEINSPRPAQSMEVVRDKSTSIMECPFRAAENCFRNRPAFAAVNSSRPAIVRTVPATFVSIRSSVRHASYFENEHDERRGRRSPRGVYLCRTRGNGPHRHRTATGKGRRNSRACGADPHTRNPTVDGWLCQHGDGAIRSRAPSAARRTLFTVAIKSERV